MSVGTMLVGRLGVYTLILHPGLAGNIDSNDNSNNTHNHTSNSNSIAIISIVIVIDVHPILITHNTHIILSTSR